MAGWWTRLLSGWTSLMGSLRPEQARQAEAWRQKRERMVAHKTRATYDAYADLPTPPARMRLVILSGSLMQTVDLEGYSLHELNLVHPRRQAWLIDQIAEARYLLAVRLDVADKARRAAQPTPHRRSTDAQ